MPVRKIPKKYLNVTGGFASRKNGRMVGFEPSMEKELMILLEFGDTVGRSEGGPGCLRRYVVFACSEHEKSANGIAVEA